MFAWTLKMIVVLALASGAGFIPLERTGSTNEAPGIWADQPDTIPVCESAKDADKLMSAYVRKDPDAEWDAILARQELSVTVSMDVRSCHFERLPDGLDELDYFMYVLERPAYRGIMVAAPTGKEDGHHVSTHGIATVFIEINGVLQFIIFTDSEAAVRAYGIRQYEIGKEDGFTEGYVAGRLATQIVPSEPPFDPAPADEQPRATFREL